MEVVVVVKGGMVQLVFANSTDVSVEVLDLDVPEYVTESEQHDFDQKEKQVKEMAESPDWHNGMRACSTSTMTTSTSTAGMTRTATGRSTGS